MFKVCFEGKLADSAYTLDPDEVCSDHSSKVGLSSCTHSDGWTISGDIKEDYYYWVNSFEAFHAVYGRVWGDFEEVVYADSEEGYLKFFAAHTPQSWDYWDI